MNIMNSAKVGAGILSIITESLYDNPIVVFREYVQNSVDSIYKSPNPEERKIKIWVDGSNVFFLDNGLGIEPERFYDEMVSIGASTKEKQKNLGYKGIGRLSGVPYCKKLSFINFVDFKNNQLQRYTIDGELYNSIKYEQDHEQMSFSELMHQIGEFEESIEVSQLYNRYESLNDNAQLLTETNSGFLVILQDISTVLLRTITGKDFFLSLQWLLPVDFDDSLYEGKYKELFTDLKDNSSDYPCPIRSCSIFYNNKPVLRPIKEEMLRDYVCKCDFKYATGFHSFNNDKIAIDRNNPFTGIRIYMDNMLLCDENELLNSLDNYGILAHTSNGQLQSVRGIGAMIYITDKISISANARRTFIEVTDRDSIDFLKLLAEFINNIYEARYALSNYASAKKKIGSNLESLSDLRERATNSLLKLASNTIDLSQEESLDFISLSQDEKKRLIKKAISSEIDKKIKDYIRTIDVDDYEIDNSINQFVDWLIKSMC